MSGVNLLDAALPAQDHPAASKSWPGESLKSSPGTGNEPTRLLAWHWQSTRSIINCHKEPRGLRCRDLRPSDAKYLSEEPMRQIFLEAKACTALWSYLSDFFQVNIFVFWSLKAVTCKGFVWPLNHEGFCLLWCSQAEEQGRKKLMTGYFHVSYRGTLSQRCRWARQSTTSSRSEEQGFIWFILSRCL